MLLPPSSWVRMLLLSTFAQGDFSPVYSCTLDTQHCKVKPSTVYSAKTHQHTQHKVQPCVVESPEEFQVPQMRCYCTVCWLTEGCARWRRGPVSSNLHSIHQSRLSHTYHIQLHKNSEGWSAHFNLLWNKPFTDGKHQTLQVTVHFSV